MATQTRVTRGPNPILEWRYALSDGCALLGSRYGWPMLAFGPDGLSRIDSPERFGPKPDTRAKFATWCRAFEESPS
jgi:hypothetical protein